MSFVKEQKPVINNLFLQNYKNFNRSVELIKQYEPFLKSYENLLNYGLIDLRNRSIRIFLSKFTGGDISSKKKYVNSFKYANKSKNLTEHGLYSLRKIRKELDDSEFKQDLIVTLLILARRYEQRNRSFEAYITSAFPHEIYRHIRHLHLNVSFGSKSYNDLDSEEKVVEKTKIEEESTIKMDLDGDFELMHSEWLSGKLANEPFKSMTKNERYIIAKYYGAKFDEMTTRKMDRRKLCTDKEIGRKLAKNIRSVNRLRLKMVKKLKSEWEEGNSRWLGVRKR